MTSGEYGENGVNAAEAVVEASVFGTGTATHGGNNCFFAIQFSTQVVSFTRKGTTALVWKIKKRLMKH